MRQVRKKDPGGRHWAMVGMAVTLVLGAGGVWWLHEHPPPLFDFSVSEIRVRGNAHVTTEEVLARLGLDAPVSVLELGLAQVAGRITTHPWIRNASIRRQIPLGLIITVEERQAVGLVVTGKNYLVSADAVILEEVEETLVPALPTVRPTWSVEYRAGEYLRDPRLLGGFQLLELLRKAPRLRRMQVQEVTVEADGNYILQLTGDRAFLRLGPAEPLPQLSRLDVALRHRGQGLESFAYVDLRFPGRVILKPLEKGG